MSSSLEHLVAGSQGVITKRIDLALLEARELLSRTFRGVALVGIAILLAIAAWFALTASVVLWAMPEAPSTARLAVFGLINGATAVGLVLVAGRHGRQSAAATQPVATREPLVAAGES